MHSIEFPLLSCSEKNLKMPWKNLRENSGNFVSQECGHPVQDLFKIVKYIQLLTLYSNIWDNLNVQKFPRV